MEWIAAHLEGIVAIGAAICAFASWNIGQGFEIKSVKSMISAVEKAAKDKSEIQQKEIDLLRSHYEQNQRHLTDELRRIGEKLAHIEGFLTARKSNNTERARA